MVARAKLSGRQANKNYKTEEKAFEKSIRKCILEEDSRCAVCGKTIAFFIGVLKSEDEHHVPRHPYGTSADQIKCGGGYVGNNVRQTHYVCNVGRKNNDKFFRKELLEYNLTKQEEIDIRKNNLFILSNNFNVTEILPLSILNNLTNNQMKNTTKSNIVISQLTLSNPTSKYLRSVAEILDKAQKQFDELTTNGVQETKARSYDNISAEMHNLCKKVFSKYFKPGIPFSMKDACKKTASDLGVQPDTVQTKIYSIISRFGVDSFIQRAEGTGMYKLKV
jgi:hypothetical protein